MTIGEHRTPHINQLDLAIRLDHAGTEGIQVDVAPQCVALVYLEADIVAIANLQLPCQGDTITGGLVLTKTDVLVCQLPSHRSKTDVAPVTFHVVTHDDIRNGV